jgi:hypothetical protein
MTNFLGKFEKPRDNATGRDWKSENLADLPKHNAQSDPVQKTD